MNDPKLTDEELADLTTVAGTITNGLRLLAEHAEQRKEIERCGSLEANALATQVIALTARAETTEARVRELESELRAEKRDCSNAIERRDELEGRLVMLRMDLEANDRNLTARAEAAERRVRELEQDLHALGANYEAQTGAMANQITVLRAGDALHKVCIQQRDREICRADAAEATLAKVREVQRCHLKNDGVAYMEDADDGYYVRWPDLHRALEPKP
jgi:chromosome segregation ATPase